MSTVLSFFISFLFVVLWLGSVRFQGILPWPVSTHKWGHCSARGQLVCWAIRAAGPGHHWEEAKAWVVWIQYVPCETWASMTSVWTQFHSEPISSKTLLHLRQYVCILLRPLGCFFGCYHLLNFRVFGPLFQLFSSYIVSLSLFVVFPDLKGMIDNSEKMLADLHQRIDATEAFSSSAQDVSCFKCEFWKSLLRAWSSCTAGRARTVKYYQAVYN